MSLLQQQRNDHVSETASATIPSTTLTRQPTPPQDFTIFTSIRCDPILASSQDNAEYSARTRGCAFYTPELHRQRLLDAARTFWPGKVFKELESLEAFEAALDSELEERERLHETFMCPMKAKYSFTSTGRTTFELSPIPALPLEALFPTTFRLPSSHSDPASKSRYAPTSPSSHLSRYSPAPSSPSSRRSNTPPSEDYFSTRSGGSASSRSSTRSDPRRQRTELAACYEIYIDTVPTPQDAHTSFKTSHRPVYNAARERALPDSSDMSQEVLLYNPSGLVTEGSVLTPYFYRKGVWVTPAVCDGGGQQGTSRRWALERGLAVEGIVEVGSLRVGEKVWLSNGVRGFGWGRICAAKGGGRVTRP